MGWFDKKSWKMRRKIKDLQADLKNAEAEGKFVVEDGLFFAELEDMGEMTMMVFGTVDTLASSEDSVIRQFFDRNGFTVERLKLDRGHTGLAEVEIIPPEEMTRAVGRALKTAGFRMIDDSENELAPDLEGRIYPFSALIRAITTLFSERVQEVIGTTRIKLNKEGNRLLHWMPKIVEAIATKVPRDVVEQAREAFNEAYAQFYQPIGHGSEVSPTDKLMHGGSSGLDSKSSKGPLRMDDKIPSPDFGNTPPSGLQSVQPPPPPRPKAPEGSVASSVDGVDFHPYKPRGPQVAPAPTAAPRPAPAPPRPAAKPAASAPAGSDEKLVRARELAEALARMYKALVKANPSRCVRNSEAILEEINKLFQAAATCVMVKVVQGHGLTIHAQAGKKLVWGEDGGQGFPISSSVLGHCIKIREVVTNLQSPSADPTASMVAHKIEATAAAPISVNDEIVGIVYIDRRGGVRPFSDEDAAMLKEVVKIFEEFPDLTLGLM
ncbi:MAG: GAF domain-containing protein [Candidatus Sumerlaeaceae bacterium]|nr:GAF domain-containing protein [Candidatus Sumerlaeaceae bacterium]